MKIKPTTLFARFFLALWVIPLVAGCGTAKKNSDSEFQYGNPQYKHVRALPQNQPEPAGRQPEEAKRPELTATEYENLGDAYLRQKNFALAYLQYEKALEKNPRNPVVAYKIALTYLSAGKTDEAQRHFEALSQKDPENALVWQGLGQVFFHKKEYTVAESYFLKALGYNNRLWESHTFLGYIYDSMEQHDRAAGQYRAALSIQPDSGPVYNNLGVSYSLAGKFPEAIESFKMALEHRYTHPKVYNNLGLALARTNRYEEALEVFKKTGDAPSAYNNLGRIHLHAGRYDDAIACFEKAVELSPRFNPRASENLKIAQNLKAKNLAP